MIFFTFKQALRIKVAFVLSFFERLDLLLGAEAEEVLVLLDQLLEAGDLLLALVALVRLGEGGAANQVLDADLAVAVLALAHRAHPRVQLVAALKSKSRSRPCPIKMFGVELRWIFL